MMIPATGGHRFFALGAASALVAHQQTRGAFAFGEQPTGLTLLSFAPSMCSHLGADGSDPMIIYITKTHPQGVDFCYVVTVGLEPTTPSM